MLVNVRNAKKSGLAWRKTVSACPEAEVWERFHMNWGYFKDQGDILVIVEAGLGWMEAFPAGYRTLQTMKVYVSPIFSRLGVPKTLVSDNGPELISGDLNFWCESLWIKKMISLIYHPRANGLAERKVQTVKRAIQAWSPNLNVSTGAFLQQALMTHRNTSKTWGKTTVEIMLGRKVRLPEATDFDLCESVLFKPTSTSSTVLSLYWKKRPLYSSSQRIQTRQC